MSIRPVHHLAEALPDPRTARIVAARGAIAGCFGAGALAIWFLLIDALVRVPMWSPSLVGRVVLEGVPVSAPVQVDLGVVGVFSIVHCAMFAVFGIAATFTLHRAAIRPLSLIGITGLAAGLQAGVVLTTGFLAPGLGDRLGWLYLGGGNIVAAVTMAICLSLLPKAE